MPGLGYFLGPTYDEILKGYIQAYTQNMQNGIKRLNIDPQTAGVTPINGALLLSVSDCAVPSRGGNLAVGRFYNSKIWYADSHETAAGKKDHLKAYSWLGMGWNLHFGCYYKSQADTAGLVFEAPSGNRIYYQYSETLGKYVATDGSFNYYKNDTSKPRTAH
jgi:hypothetical protein